MGSHFSPGSGPGPGSETDFSFAFNNINFSDRVLRIEIVPDLPDDKPDGDGPCTICVDWARSRKRRREDILKETDVVLHPEEQILTYNKRDTEGGVTYENLDEEAVVMVEELPSSAGKTTDQLGDEATQDNDSSYNMECSTVIQIKTLYISSPILAAKSPFFYKLFSNGMRESEQHNVTLCIQASEEAALMELLNFMYSNKLSTTAPSAVLDVLMAADKFDVASCMRYCSQLLRNSPMTYESALLYLDLPSGVLMSDAVQPLRNAVKQFLVARFKDITRFQEEVLNLPLAGIEAVFSSDNLQVASEDAVYDFVLKWARVHYPNLEERRKILSTRLAHVIRFQHMTCRKLMNILTCDDFDPLYASNFVLGSLLFKADPLLQHSLAAEANTYRRCVEQRAYIYRPVKVIAFKSPCPQCVVYLDLKKEECANLFPDGHVRSQVFLWGRQDFALYPCCSMDQSSSFRCFGLFLGMLVTESVSLVADYEFAARSKPTNEFVSKYRGNFTVTGPKTVGIRNLFGISWTAFMAEDSIYFINGVLHLRAKLTIKQ